MDKAAITIRTGDPKELAEWMHDIVARGLQPDDQVWFQWFRNHNHSADTGEPVVRLPNNPLALENAVGAMERLIDQPGRSRQLGVTKTDLVHAIDALETIIERLTQ